MSKSTRFLYPLVRATRSIENLTVESGMTLTSSQPKGRSLGVVSAVLDSSTFPCAFDFFCFAPFLTGSMERPFHLQSFEPSRVGTRSIVSFSISIITVKTVLIRNWPGSRLAAGLASL